MQERARNFDLPHLPSGEVAHLVIRAFRQRDACKHIVGARAAFLFADAMQGGVVGQILNDGEIEVEGARLEHHADHAQRFARRAYDIMTENPDAGRAEWRRDA
jgi:hypothetical protein